MKSNLTFEELPTAVGQLLLAVTELSALVKSERACPPCPPSKDEPIGIDEACRILGKAKPTVYHLARTGGIPCCKRGKKLYFFEDELLSHIAEGRRKTVAEIYNK